MVHAPAPDWPGCAARLLVFRPRDGALLRLGAAVGGGDQGPHAEEARVARGDERAQQEEADAPRRRRVGQVDDLQGGEGAVLGRVLAGRAGAVHVDHPPQRHRRRPGDPAGRAGHGPRGRRGERGPRRAHAAVRGRQPERRPRRRRRGAVGRPGGQAHLRRARRRAEADHAPHQRLGRLLSRRRGALRAAVVRPHRVRRAAMRPRAATARANPCRRARRPRRRPRCAARTSCAAACARAGS